jgi:amino acid transporter
METGKHGLKRELKLWDLVAMQVILIVSLTWTGFAAKQGSSQIVLWVMAIVLFYLPQAAVVMKMSRAMPVEGGAYQWVRAGLSPFAGYMAGWSLTVGCLALYASIGPQLANGFAFAGGPGGAWMGTSKPFAVALTAFACLVSWVLNNRGLHEAKWLGSAGSALTFAAFLAMLFLLVRAWVGGLPSAHQSFSLAWPGLSFATLNVFTKMALAGLSGFDQSAVFSEECRKPENDVARSVLIAAPLIALMYVLGTSAVLAYTAPANVDLGSPVGQLFQAGFGVTGTGRTLASIAIGSFGIGFLAALVIATGMISRLPMVAGWDGLLPQWWSALHPRFRTPTKAIIAVTGAMFVLAVLSLMGAGNQEAVEVLAAAGIGSLCIVYILLFGSVLLGFRSHNSSVRLSVGIRLAALPAFLVSLVSLIFEFVAPGEVADVKVFAIKVGAAIFAINGVGAYLYWRGARRLAAVSATDATVKT